MSRHKKWRGWGGDSAPVFRTSASVVEATNFPFTARTQRRESSKAQQPKWVLWICLGLVFLTFLTYAQVRHFDFVNYDDPDYVSKNPHILADRITLSNIVWAITSIDNANWMPLPRLSWMLDWQVFGSDAGLWHLENVLFHAIATLLLFAFLKRATGALWRSAAVAALFAVSPLHVESVAWIAERKDVLSGCFFFLALWAYVRYTERPSLRSYALVFTAFCLSLMSKPMAVTLPFVLLLLDFWPLRRSFSDRLILVEKLPFVLVSAIGSVIAFTSQRLGGAVQNLDGTPISLRLENALVSYVIYVYQTVVPIHLGVFYPYPKSIPGWQAAGGAVLLVLASAVVVTYAWTKRYLTVGWFWFLGTLVPVIGFVQVGLQAHADHFMYLPGVGLFVIAVWGLGDICKRWGGTRLTTAAGAALCIGTHGVLAHFQADTWRDSTVLWRNVVESDGTGSLTGNVRNASYQAFTNYAASLMANDPALAADQLRRAIKLDPDRPEAYVDLGAVLTKQGRVLDALPILWKAESLAPRNAATRYNLGIALAKQGNRDEAICEFQEAARLDPERYKERLSQYPEMHIQ